jgi:hypothetical protein
LKSEYWAILLRDGEAIATRVLSDCKAIAK